MLLLVFLRTLLQVMAGRTSGVIACASMPAARQDMSPSHLMYDVGKPAVALIDLLADDGGLRVRLQRALQRDVAGGAAHEPHKMIILLGGQRIHHQVAYHL